MLVRYPCSGRDLLLRYLPCRREPATAAAPRCTKPKTSVIVPPRTQSVAERGPPDDPPPSNCSTAERDAPASGKGCCHHSAFFWSRRSTFVVRSSRAGTRDKANLLERPTKRCSGVLSDAPAPQSFVLCAGKSAIVSSFTEQRRLLRLLE